MEPGPGTGFSRAGLSIGLPLIGHPFKEATLFRVAHAHEAVSPFQSHRPGVLDRVSVNSHH